MCEKYKISFEVSPTEAYNNVLNLLETIQTLGLIGATRQIGFKDAVNEQEEKWSVLFDGDGNHRIKNIKGEAIYDVRELRQTKG